MASLNVYPTLSEVNNYLTNILHRIQLDSHFETRCNLFLINAMRAFYGQREMFFRFLPLGPQPGEAGGGQDSALPAQGLAVRLHAEPASRTQHGLGDAGGTGLLATGEDLIEPEDSDGQHQNQWDAKQENVAPGLDQFFVHVTLLKSRQNGF